MRYFMRYFFEEIISIDYFSIYEIRLFGKMIFRKTRMLFFLIKRDNVFEKTRNQYFIFVNHVRGSRA